MGFQVTDAKKPILCAGKICSKSEHRIAWYDGSGGVLRHEGAGLVKVKKVKHHYALECWATKSATKWRTTSPIVAPVVAPARPAPAGKLEGGQGWMNLVEDR